MDLEAASQRGITVAEVTYCNSISVVRECRDDDLALVQELSAVARLGASETAGTSRTAPSGHTTRRDAFGTVAAGRIGQACCAG